MSAVRTILLLLFGSVLVALALCLLLRRDPFVLQGFDLIQVGMTEKEVVEVIGRSAGDYRTTQFINFGDFMTSVHQGGATSDQSNEKTWIADNAAFAVAFDSRGKVVNKYYQPVPLRASERLDHQRWTR